MNLKINRIVKELNEAVQWNRNNKWATRNQCLHKY